MKKKAFKLFIFAAALVLGVFSGMLAKPVNAEAATAKVVLEMHDGSKKTWKSGKNKINLQGKTITYVYFGRYPQTELTGKKLTNTIKYASYNKNGVAKIEGKRYKRTVNYDLNDDRVISYFKYEPIKWKVISNKDGYLTLLAETTLDCKKYNNKLVDITWGDSSIRKWLNKGFLSSAFNSAEKKLLKKVTIKNYASRSGAEATRGKQTKDFAYLLSLDDIYEGGFGLSKDNDARECAASDFARIQGSYYMNSYIKWWLRSSGSDNQHAAIADLNGEVDSAGYGFSISCGVRPVITLNLQDIVKGIE